MDGFLRQCLMSAVAMLVATYVVPAHAQRFATFGKTTASGAVPTAGLATRFRYASRFSLTESATVRDICVYMDGRGGGTGRQFALYFIYSDANGVPGKMLLGSGGRLVEHGAPPQWLCGGSPGFATFIEAGSVIPAGRYWIAVLTSESDGVIRTYLSGTAQNWYSAPGDDRPHSQGNFGSATAEPGTLAAYVRYYPSSQVRNAGKLAIGKLVSQPMVPEAKRVSSFLMPEGGKLLAISSYLDGLGTDNIDGYTPYLFVLYKDANGVPGEKVWQSLHQHEVQGAQRPFWRSDESLSGRKGTPVLSAGRYWIGIHTGGFEYAARYYYDHGGSWYGNSDLIIDGSSTPFGAGTAKNDTITAYISYRPGPPTTGEIGRTDIASTPSRALDPNVTRWSAFDVVDSEGTLTTLHAHLDGLGATSGSQDVRMVLYAFTGFQEGYRKLAESNVVTIPAGMSKRWVDFPVPPVALDAFSVYLIGLQSGPNPVARIYGDNRYGVSWGSRPDTFADGPNETIPVDETEFLNRFTGPVTLSVYATYSLPPP